MGTGRYASSLNRVLLPPPSSSSRAPHHRRARRAPPTTVELVARSHHQLCLKGRNSRSAAFGSLRRCSATLLLLLRSTAAVRHMVGLGGDMCVCVCVCRVGGMSLPDGSRHLDTRSSCGAHAHPKCLTGCGCFLATRAFRAIVTRAATSRERREVKGRVRQTSRASLAACSYSLLFVKVL